MFERRADRHVDLSMPVRVYRNLHRTLPDGTAVYSIAQRRNGRWLVMAYTDHLTMMACRFIVSDAGRERVRATGKKVVHAFVEGCLVEAGRPNAALPHRATYNPYRDRTFVDRATGTALGLAAWVRIGPEDGVTYNHR